MAPATSCFISRKRIWRCRPASISSTDLPPGWPTMNGVPAALNASASTSTVVATHVLPSPSCLREILYDILMSAQPAPDAYRSGAA